MTEDELRRMLLWLAECDEEEDSPPFPCGTCGHSRYAHEVGGDADNPEPWPCLYPKYIGAPVALCTCADYEPMRDD